MNRLPHEELLSSIQVAETLSASDYRGRKRKIPSCLLNSGKVLKADMEISISPAECGKGMVEGIAVHSKDLGICRCNELEEERKKYEMRFAELDVEIKKKNYECKALEAKNKTLEVEKSTAELELKILKRKIVGLVGKDEVCYDPKTKIKGMVDFREVGDEEDEMFRIKAENQVLECKNKYSEIQIEDWKNKYKKLQSQVLLSDLKPEGKKDLNLNMQESGTPSNYREWKKVVCTVPDVRYRQKVRKQLKFEGHVPGKNMTPSSPCSRKPAYPGVVCIINDDEPNNNTVHVPVLDGGEDRNGSLSKYCAPERSASTENQFKDEEDMDVSEENSPYIGALKRKRIGSVFISDSDTDDDDDVIPISKLRMKHLKEETSDRVHVDFKSVLITDIVSDDPIVKQAQPPARRRLIPLRNCVSKNQEYEKHSAPRAEKVSRPKNEDFEDNKIKNSSSESEGYSLRDFIILSDNEDSSGHVVESSSPESPSDEVNFTRILSKIRREKNCKKKWEYEGEMLAAFATVPQLCMKAVCALYRQQTSDEKTSKETLYCNNRGFSKFDAQRGCKIAEFLTNGDPQGDLHKSVEELQEFDSKGVELCRALANHYSKQLFAIYRNREDPLFLP